MPLILIVDDDDFTCKMLSNIVISEGHQTLVANDLNQGLRYIFTHPVDIVFLDVKLPDGNGIQSISAIQEADSSPEVIIITGVGDPDGAELAIRLGAWDYVQKPFSHQEAILPLKRALQYRKHQESNAKPVALDLSGIVGHSKKMKQAYDTLAKAAACDANVLLTGETGTGKELFAKAIHQNSFYVKGPFVVVDCGALPETLVESTLFGHEKGAFTGASLSKMGMFKEADGGTLFMDEIGELPTEIQKKLLRVLQEHVFRPVGARKDESTAFRLVVATNRNLEQMVEEKSFRSDLFFRLLSIEINLPPLRERNGDISDLAFHYMKAYCDRLGIGTKGLSTDFYDAITRYSWPGNVRELTHAIERAVSMAREEPTLFAVHLPVHIRADLIRKDVQAKPTEGIGRQKKLTDPVDFLPLREMMESNEEQYLSDLMQQVKGNVQKAIAISGLSKTRLYARLNKYNIRAGK